MPTKSLQARVRNSRSSRGSFMIFVAVLGVFVLLPLGLVGFELNRISMAQTQLRTATDAAVLAASQAYRNAAGAGNELDIAKAAGIKFFQANTMLGGDLSSAVPGSGNPQANESFINITFDAANNVMTADASANMQLAFGNFFSNIGMPIVAFSRANVSQQEETDIVIALDTSGSMASDNALNDAKPVLCNFIDELTQGDSNHFGLVCYSTSVHSQLPLSASAVNATEVKAMINAQTPTGATQTPGGMNKVYSMLASGAGHRPTAKRLFVLVTDGLPNVTLSGQSSESMATADCYSEGTKIGQTSVPPPPGSPPPDPSHNTEGIKLAAIGFFHSDAATRAKGMNVLNNIAQKVKDGGGSHGAEADVYTASNIAELQEALNKISTNELRLVN